MYTLDIPQDIINMIVDLCGDDVSTLKNCALVSNAWTPVCHRHLFHTLTIGGSQRSIVFRPKLLKEQPRNPTLTPRQFPDFAGFLETSPHIASDCIRFLKLRFDSSGVSQLIPMILSKLTGVEEVELDIGVWTNYSVNFRQSVHSLIQQISVSTVSITDAKFESILDISSLLARSSSLGHFGIFRADIRNMPSKYTYISDTTSAPIHLHFVRLHSIPMNINLLPSLLHPLSRIGLSRLHRLDVDLPNLCGPQREDTEKLFEQCRSSLSHLSLHENPISSFQPNDALLDLFSFPNLRSFCFIGYRSSMTSSYLQWIIKLFDRTTAPWPLEDIEISMRMYTSSDPITNRTHIPDESIYPWRELDYALTRFTLHRLRRVKLAIIAREAGQDSLRAAEIKLRNALPLLTAHPGNILVMEFAA